MPNPENREQFEQDLEAVLEKAFRNARRGLEQSLYRDGLTMRDLALLPPDALQDIRNDMIQDIQPILYTGYLQAAQTFAASIQYSLDEDTLQEHALTWSATYTPQLVDGVLDTSRNRLSQMATQAEPLPLNRRRLAGILLIIFALSRIMTIARTEITNAFSAGEHEVQRQLQGNGATVTPVWFTQEDERVCPICAPRHGKKQGDGWQNPPPAHPRCRCYEGYMIDKDGKRTIVFDDEIIARQLRRS